MRFTCPFCLSFTATGTKLVADERLQEHIEDIHFLEKQNRSWKIIRDIAALCGTDLP